ncbi:MAG: 1-acyl-sn-glycerol-3-phosphate acyltransferase [Sinobacteraceae bacterium]|nr:1-acyl-sn-glycerol-3-phosphate acyltransferase [Nevskiaceae bacterium]MCP5339248.1 1-acyl-sn-glycerol-3-phosphate acyltransferase [Nevskiaceae bacterium]MCP5359403.1 1-acyl-sn-glycerol-3-phosphate acyltransferase [Nevskiaceae bacterium]MCP5467326.1 1-acyl-sn-glycerol-3-phosphate acyltransferase [Nevskiaceae bacterium]MCP5470842.1 1-acyl-sn-glycerol-3-phosphate acyltransferase [Nevskiaceae bacterium]
MRPSSALLVGVVKLLVGAYGRWFGIHPRTDAQRIYFANHTSHIDTLAIWAALPYTLRRRTRPVAARDYWGRGLRRYLATRALGAVLIDRAREQATMDPLEPLRAALRAGDSLILFPEGTRGTRAAPARFRGGLHRLALEFPAVELLPVYLDNLHRALPKGSLLPVPMVCTVRFGAPLARIDGEPRNAFLARARAAVMTLGGVTETDQAADATGAEHA